MKYLIKGELFDPIIFGKEEDCWAPESEDETCGDCGCHVGEQHLEYCDIERCPRCGLQFISCDCGVKYCVDEKDMKLLSLLIKQQVKDNIQLEKDIKEALEKHRKRQHDEDSEM